MTTTIGISVEANDVFAVVVTRGRATRAVHCPLDSSVDLREALVTVLASVGKTAKDTDTRIVLGPTRCQTRGLADVPLTGDRKALDAVIRNQAGMLFRNGAGGVITISREKRPGWAECFDAATVDLITETLRELRFGLRAIVSVPTALAVRTGTGSFEWSDGGIVMRGECDGGRLIHLDRAFHARETTTEAGTPAQVRVIDPNREPRLAPALAAAMSRLPFPIGINPHKTRRARPVPMWRLHVASAVFATALVVALVSPFAVVELIHSRDAAALGSMAPAVRRAEERRRSLASIETTLAAIRGFEHRTRNWAALLAEVTHLLPPNATISQFQADSAGGHLVVFSDRAMDVLVELESSESFVTSVLDGGIGRERIGERDLEKATIRFEFGGRAR